MITTAGTAKEKWCPFDKGQTSPREHITGMCIGPDCMMWRYWLPPSELNVEKPKHGIRDKDKKGYCGLAGIY
jgi:hypothetical protein